jgi:hypothetical protein
MKKISSFNSLVKAIDQCPKLMFLNETDPIEVFTDASKYGIGGIIYQRVKDIRVPIAILSKSLTASERKWAVEEKKRTQFMLCKENMIIC